VGVLVASESAYTQCSLVLCQRRDWLGRAAPKWSILCRMAC